MTHHAVYRGLLELTVHDALDRLLPEALAALSRAVGASSAYLELYELDGATASIGLDAQSEHTVQASISRGIIAHAVAGGEAILTLSALADPRFSKHESVRRHRLKQVLCAPIGSDPVRGVVFLSAGDDSAPFTETDRLLAAEFGLYLWPIADRVIARSAIARAQDATAPWRARLACEELVGSSPALARVLQAVAQAAPVPVSVLLLGPTGAGKSLVARAIHANSQRSAGPFVTVNCPAIPDELFASELFGVARGAFTGATARAGLVRTARGGTLFLDEVGDLSPANQAKLLHFLETGEIRRVGADCAERTDVRVVAATNAPLDGGEGFRRDLYYRLAGFPIRVPGLEERREDLVSLARSLVRRSAHAMDLPVPELGPAAIRAVLVREWPGNIRDLANIAQQAVVRAHAERVRVLEPRHLFPDRNMPSGEVGTFQECTRQFQAELLRGVLGDTGWNVTEAARRLDLSRQHVYNLIAAFGLHRE